MDIFLQLTLTGIVNGLAYALIGFGFIAIYRVTNMVNFAQGEFLMLGGFLAYALQRVAVPWPIALVVAVAITAAIGVFVHRVAIQPAGADASVEALVIITIGVSFTLRGVSQLLWGSDALPVPPFTGSTPIRFLRIAVVPQALWVIAFSLATVILLWLFFTRTTAGLAQRACAENRSGAHLAGIDSWRMGRWSFAIGCGLAGLIGVVLTPLSFVSFSVGLILAFKGFTAAILGGLSSFTAAAVGGVILGLLESYGAGYVSSSYRDAFTFVMLIIILVVRPSGLTSANTSTDHGHIPGGAMNDQALQRALAGFGGNRRALAVAAFMVLVAPLYLSNASTGSLAFAGYFALVGLGVVLLLGYAGQISLAHAALMGIGGYAAASLTVKAGWPPVLALLAGAVCAVVTAKVLAHIIFRFRGFYLAMATLGLAIIFTVVATNLLDITGGASGITGIKPFGIGELTLRSPRSNFYFIWSLVLLVIVGCLLLVDSRFGRAMRAVKDSQEAASALGVDIASVKSSVFVIAGVLAAIAGSLYVHFATLALPRTFDLFQAVRVLVMVVVGGAHSLWGAVVGSVFLIQVPELIQEVLPGARAGQIEQVLFGIALMAVMVLRPDGLTGVLVGLRKPLDRVFGTLPFHRRKRAVGAERPLTPADDLVEAMPAAADDHVSAGGAPIWFDRPEKAPIDGRPILRLQGVSKSFGGLQALQPLSIEVPHGAITALIGPNGAGKTTAFNCITGALEPDSGDIVLDGVSIDGLPTHAIAQAGLVRTFQNVQLFPNMTALENVMVGCHSWTGASYVEGALRVGRHRTEESAIRSAAEEALRFVGLESVGGRAAANLPFGYQRLLELARSLAAKPRILLLDEPAAGLNRAEKDRLMATLRVVRDAGITLLLIEHDMGVVMGLADSLTVLDYGAVIATGTPTEVRANQRVVEAYLGVPG